MTQRDELNAKQQDLFDIHLHMINYALQRGYSYATYSSPTADQEVSLGMLGFVDDCNGQTNSFTLDGSHVTVLTLVDQTQKNAQAWNDLLSVSASGNANMYTLKNSLRRF